jgi:chromosome segregation ATPase
MAEDIDGALGIRATIDADDIKTSAQQWVDTITGMQSKTNEVVQGMNDSLSSLQKQVDEFGKAASGMSLSELASQLDSSKAAFVSLGDDIRQQREIIKETTADLGDLQRAYKEAKNEGNTSASDEMSKQIDNYKEGLAAQRRELNSMVAQQQAEKDKITELTQAYKELQSSQPTFENIVNGAGTAAERVQALRDSFANFQTSLQSSQDAVTGLSQESAKSTAAGDNGMADISKTISTRYIVEGADEVQQKSQDVANGLKNVEASYASAAATATTAYSEQKKGALKLCEQKEITCL